MKKLSFVMAVVFCASFLTLQSFASAQSKDAKKLYEAAMTNLHQAESVKIEMHYNSVRQTVTSPYTGSLSGTTIVQQKGQGKNMQLYIESMEGDSEGKGLTYYKDGYIYSPGHVAGDIKMAMDGDTYVYAVKNLVERVPDAKYMANATTKSLAGGATQITIKVPAAEADEQAKMLTLSTSSSNTGKGTVTYTYVVDKDNRLTSVNLTAKVPYTTREGKNTTLSYTCDQKFTSYNKLKNLPFPTNASTYKEV